MIFRFVPNAHAGEWQSLGWEDRGPAPGHHGHWSRVMIWRGEGEVKEPERREGGAMHAGAMMRVLGADSP